MSECNQTNVQASRIVFEVEASKFDGRGDAEAALRWVEELEKVFEVLGCTEEEKVTLAVYQLQSNASDW